MTTVTEQVNKLAKDWLYEDGDDTFEIDGVEFEFAFASNSKGTRYEMWADGELIGWNDCRKDFHDIGYCVNAYLTESVA
jgi:hypothetical protein